MTTLLAGLRNPVIALGAIAFALLFSIAAASRGIGIWLAVVVGAGLLRYPYLLTLSASQGAREPPPVAIEDFNPATGLHYLLHVAVQVGVAWVLRVPLALGLVPVMVIMALWMPATVAVMGVTGNLLSAFNPLGLLELAKTLGSTYLVLVMLVLGLGAIALGVEGWLEVPLLAHALAIHALLVSFDASGRALHLHRHEVPFVATTISDRREIGDRRHAQHDWEDVLDRSYRAARSGDTAHGLRGLHELLVADEHRLESYELLWGHVREWQLQEVTAPFARAFIDRLLQADAVHRAMEVTEACLRRDPTFRPSPAAGVVVAAHARSVGHEGTAALLHVPGADELL